MYCIVARCTIALSVAVMLLGLSLGNASAQDTAQIARGKYLVEALRPAATATLRGACRVSPI